MKNMTKLKCQTLGVDPGLSGGMVLINEKKEILSKTVFPRTNGVLNCNAISKWLEGKCIDHVFLEHVHALPLVGAGSSFKFGLVFGQIRAILSLSGLGYTLVSPRRWQTIIGVNLKHLKPKQRALLTAQELYEGCDLRKSPRSKVWHDGLVDAALIAYYGLKNISDF